MKILPWKLRRAASETLLSLRLAHLRQRLRNNSQPPCFERVCVVAPLEHKNGIVKGAILQYEALTRIGIDAELLDSSPGHRNPFFRLKHKPATAYIFHCPGLQIASLISTVLPAAAEAYRVAYWAWELPAPPKDWPNPGNLVSEIWTCSEYSKTSLAMRYRIPIRVCHHAVEPLSLPRIGSPNKFTVLVLADTRSSLHRKNPLGAIEAYKKAFGDQTDVRLIVKINGPSTELKQHIARMSVKTAEVVEGFLDQQAMNQLMGSASVLLSLHRAEGFGLPMLEAMSLGVPTIATGWSGNLDFMNSQNSLLIPSKQVPIRDSTIYARARHSLGCWADPDIPEAAKALQLLYRSEETRRQLSQHGLATARRLFQSWSIPGPAARAIPLASRGTNC